MTDTLELSAKRIAQRGRDELLAKLRPAFAEAASAHADVFKLDADELEQMVQRAADRADGLQWRRALASVATEELGIGLGEALGHPAVRRAQAMVGAPSYEDSLAALLASQDTRNGNGAREADVPASEPPETERTSARAVRGTKTTEVRDVESPAPVARATPAPRPAVAKAEVPTAEAAAPTPEPSPQSESAPAEPEPGAPTPEPSLQSESAPAEPEPGAPTPAPGAPTPAPATPAAARPRPAAPAPESSWPEPTKVHSAPQTAAPEVAGPRPAGPPRKTPEPPAIRVAAIHLGGVTDLKPGEGEIELRLSDRGLDISRGPGEVFGRLTWAEIHGLEVPPVRGLLRRRREPRAHLVVRAEHGDASFEIPAVTPEELREHLEPLLVRHGRALGLG